MIKLSIAARKGGQARSTTAFNLAGAFAKLGYRTIVIDADAQPTVSRCFLPGEIVDGLSPEQTVCALYDETLFPFLGAVLHSTAFDGIKVIPGHVTGLARFDFPVPEDYPHLCEALRDFMPELEPHADVCIMDTAPTTYVLTYSTLVAADFAVTPVVCDKNSVQELPMVRSLIDQVVAERNQGLTWLGVFPSLFVKRQSMQQSFAATLETTLEDKFIPVPIPVAAAVSEASLARKPLPLWKPKSAAGKAFIALAEAILERVGVAKTTEVQRRVA